MFRKHLLRQYFICDCSTEDSFTGHHLLYISEDIQDDKRLSTKFGLLVQISFNNAIESYFNKDNDKVKLINSLVTEQIMLMFSDVCFATEVSGYKFSQGCSPNNSALSH